ncbi:hypothetical protein C497_08953 [Halalkalicoccus jeotgali B3]|uniref:Uncharacterized protein n=2 Tax=Halalkalicoccus jeotgali (strain DSM 18796 / CECT 7217 / JCM 14584 / KCTC 4019 / B3) TaxID=795797 RepID=L9VMU8_HALJB|nr:hypothetical protein [Halalkalicoccus jeotgali]ELY37558.1 hypothetical protein C497_08953 [Halalkalicoccus jeotgali B3]
MSAERELRFDSMNALGAVAQSGWPAAEHTPLLLAVILLAALGTLVLFLIGLAVFARRRSPRYLLVLIALGALVFRTAIGLGTVFSYVPMTLHHLLSHGLDFLIAVAILAAAYLSGPSTPGSADD